MESEINSIDFTTMEPGQASALRVDVPKNSVLLGRMSFRRIIPVSEGRRQRYGQPTHVLVHEVDSKEPAVGREMTHAKAK